MQTESVIQADVKKHNNMISSISFHKQDDSDMKSRISFHMKKEKDSSHLGEEMQKSNEIIFFLKFSIKNQTIVSILSEVTFSGTRINQFVKYCGNAFSKSTK